VPDEFKIGMINQVDNLLFFAREVIVHANYLISVIQKPFAQVRSDKTCATGYKDSFHAEWFVITTGFRPML
jgi:hypothetical protein